MNTTAVAHPIAFVLGGMVLIWFFLIHILLKRLERKHPDTYESMGKPSLFLHNTPRTANATLRFIALRQHRPLGDATLSRLSDGMMIYFALQIAVVVWTVVNGVLPLA
jgi:hypothetical protein